jgi:hypothetical protein
MFASALACVPNPANRLSGHGLRKASLDIARIGFGNNHARTEELAEEKKGQRLSRYAA